MKIDKAAICRELDVTAEKFEEAGYKDLATKVDYYASRVRAASEANIPKIYRALARVQAEYKKRASTNGKRGSSTTDRKSVVLARKLKQRDAELKKAKQENERLKKLLQVARKRAFGDRSPKPEKKASKSDSTTPEKRAEARRARMRARRKKD